jgi:hypothetical protein
MIRLVATAAIVALGLYMSACGVDKVPSAAREATPAIHPAKNSPASVAPPLPVGHYIRGDYDDDDNGGADGDDGQTRDYGHKASVADASAAEKLVKAYYMAAAARDGAGACSLMDLRLAAASDYTKVVPPEYAPTHGSSIFRGKGCAEIASLVFEPAHEKLATDAASVRVAETRVNGTHALAILVYTTDPESELALESEHGVWRVDAFLAATLV